MRNFSFNWYYMLFLIHKLVIVFVIVLSMSKSCESGVLGVLSETIVTGLFALWSLNQEVDADPRRGGRGGRSRSGRRGGSHRGSSSSSGACSFAADFEPFMITVAVPAVLTTYYVGSYALKAVKSAGTKLYSAVAGAD